MKVAYYGDEVKAGQYQVADLKIGTDKDGELDSAKSSVTITGPGGQTVAGAKISGIDGNIATITGDNGFELKLEIRSGIQKNAVTTVNNFKKMELAGFGAMDTQIGANEGQQLGIRIPRISCLNMGIESLDLTTAEASTSMLAQANERPSQVLQLLQ